MRYRLTRCQSLGEYLAPVIQRYTTDVGVYDSILAAEEEHRFMGVSCIWYLFIPKCVRVPVKVPLQEVGYPELGAYEVLDDKV